MSEEHRKCWTDPARSATMLQLARAFREVYSLPPTPAALTTMAVNAAAATAGVATEGGRPPSAAKGGRPLPAATSVVGAVASDGAVARERQVPPSTIKSYPINMRQHDRR